MSNTNDDEHTHIHVSDHTKPSGFDFEALLTRRIPCPELRVRRYPKIKNLQSTSECNGIF